MTFSCIIFLHVIDKSSVPKYYGLGPCTSNEGTTQPPLSNGISGEVKIGTRRPPSRWVPQTMPVRPPHTTKMAPRAHTYIANTYLHNGWPTGWFLCMQPMFLGWQVGDVMRNAGILAATATNNLLPYVTSPV